jgi:hypothetical protein
MKTLSRLAAAIVLLMLAMILWISPQMTTEQIVSCLLLLLGPPITTIIGWTVYFYVDHRMRVARHKRESDAFEQRMKALIASHESQSLRDALAKLKGVE